MRRAAWSIALLAAAASARAEPPPAAVLRIGTVAPEGSPWARELTAFSRGVEHDTDGGLRIKWYFNGVAGDELEQRERIARGQLDGSASGQMLCERIAPTLRLVRLPGLFRDRDEAAAVLAQLVPELEAEAHRAGFALLATMQFGTDVIFTRTPVDDLAELRRLALWRWDIDEVGIATSRAMGLRVVPLPISEVAHAYAGGTLDGMIAIPSAALAFQWSAQARYVTALRTGYIAGCVALSERVFERLPIAQQQILRARAATTQIRFDELGARLDSALLATLFRKQGGVLVPVSDRFSREFFAAADAARARAAPTFVPKPLLARVGRMIAAWRTQHRTANAR